MDGSYSLPAGHLEGKESLKEALAREVKEEIGITVGLNDMQLVHVSNNLHADPERIDFFFSVSKWKGTVSICEPNKCDQIVWKKPSELPENIVPGVKAAVKGEIRGDYYSEYRG
jgi:ADP-ribose pyrophosphatase YjhB (NUDIX family)